LPEALQRHMYIICSRVLLLYTIRRLYSNSNYNSNLHRLTRLKRMGQPSSRPPPGIPLGFQDRATQAICMGRRSCIVAFLSKNETPLISIWAHAFEDWIVARARARQRGGVHPRARDATSAYIYSWYTCMPLRRAGRRARGRIVYMYAARGVYKQSVRGESSVRRRRATTRPAPRWWSA
jgi:hypothetical protein